MRTETDLLLLRENALHIAMVLGFDPLGQVRLATATSEIGRDALQHGSGAQVLFALEEQPRPELVVTLQDAGPGFAERVSAVRELVSRCEVASSASGASITLGVILPHGYPGEARRAELALDLSRNAPGGLVDVVRRQNREMLETIEELAAKKTELEQVSVELSRAAESIKKTAAKRVRSERLEALSRLTAGIAHHYNNLLTPILGFTQLVIDGLPPENAHIEWLQEVIRAGGTAALLTRQLLAFGQKQPVRPRVLDLNAAALSMMPALRLMIDGHVLLVQDLGTSPIHVEVDEAQIADVLMSIVRNARDAMPAGSEMNISSSKVELDRSAAERLDIRPGIYACLSVLDFGCGMEPDVIARAFDPFFTTKSMAVSAGLGLAAAQGFVRQSGGTIQIESQTGIGTSVSVYLPLAKAPPSTERSVAPDTATVLVVDDEPMIRHFVELALAHRGFTVHTAASGTEALAQFARHRGKIDIAVLDVKMPQLDGFRLAEQLRELAPDLPVIMMSADPTELGLNRTADGQPGPFLQKPFVASDLLDLVRATLGRPECSQQDIENVVTCSPGAPE